MPNVFYRCGSRVGKADRQTNPMAITAGLVEPSCVQSPRGVLCTEGLLIAEHDALLLILTRRVSITRRKQQRSIVLNLFRSDRRGILATDEQVNKT